MVDEAGYTHQNEYFRIDVIGWVGHAEEMENDPDYEKVDLNPHFWDLKVAIEHENSKADWSDEVFKLIHIKCPLKVIIGYSPWNQRDEEEDDKLDISNTGLSKTLSSGNMKPIAKRFASYSTSVSLFLRVTS